MRLYQILVVLFFSLFMKTAHASYVIADLDPENAVASIGTHIVIAGQGLEAGMTWLKAAHTQALVFKDREPHGLIRLVAAVDPAKSDAYLQTLRELGYRNLDYRATEFNASELSKFLVSVPLIASMDFIGHDGAFLGFALEDEGANHRFYTKDVDRLKGHVRFAKDSYIRIIGCNTGWYLAPYMAMKWGVPAAGTLTSADVQILSADGNWYFDDAQLWPGRLGRAKTNGVSFAHPEPCVGIAGCVRLKSVNKSYTGQHGVYTGALPFMKFFCGSVDSEDCFRRMALSTRTLVGVSPMSGSVPSLDAFAATLADQFCPPTSNAARRARCVSLVTRHLKGEEALPPTFTTLSEGTPMLTCDFRRCQFAVTRDDKGNKIFVSNGPAQSTTFVDELNAYRAGLQALAR